MDRKTLGDIHPMAARSKILQMQTGRGSESGSAMEWLEETQKRIASMDQSGAALNAVLEWNAEAEGIASLLDRERMLQGARSLLHGIPVLLKDNIGTADGMHTSAGSLALADRYAPREAYIAARLRSQGAVLCGKTNMTEFANFMTENMPNGYSSRGGQVKHAWNPAADPWGSSTGSAVAVAAGYVPLAVGTETCGSIIGPAIAAGITGLKPTVGWVSRSGILPIAPSQDVAGPMARSVADCALAFSAMAGYDPMDPVTGLCIGRNIPSIEVCSQYQDGLKGVRLGLYMLDGEDQPVQSHAFQHVIQVLTSLGAELVPFAPPKGAARDMETRLLHEFRPAMDAALREDTSAVKTLLDIFKFNQAHADTCLRYGQTCIEQALRLSRPMLTEEYANACLMAHSSLNALYHSFAALDIQAVVSLHGLVVFPFTGCPALTLPVGLDEQGGLPVPIVFNGLPFSEGTLLAVGAALEHALDLDIHP